MSEYLPEGKLVSTQENINILQSPQLLSEAMNEQKILEAKAIICDSRHNLIVDLGSMKGIIPREEGAIGIREGTVRDIAVISRVNRAVSFVITDFRTDSNGVKYAVLSREKAQKKCLENYVRGLVCGDVVDARITHLENFGAFADIGCGIVALMPIDAISVSRIEHPRERFTVGMDIRAVIKSIENGRISLSHKELLGTWEENAGNFSAGETVSGIVRSVENYGAFVELSPNLAGLAESKDGVCAGQQASVYIKSIIPEKMKIKLIIIDTFDYKYNPQKPEYYTDADHISRFLYSPQNCSKVVETVFDN
ncbi:S1 RNA-binding domain-containing protein [Ruminococcus sp. YE282]|jgi:small subunit ribosomal protein S1|uniref:S1 RNA-binding domain-containing protein n=1 Tax=Ruminococcus sp. YE282 TaxID=3158780 RepID=UPI000888F8C2|nr:S1 RNA-binding domain-containing protein [Ruminococcus bromii]SCY17940.1 small subunit ribosomal protein S1 [Ruminococcus bromii]HCB94580.1 RNA-binding protein [Ruminococcus sp.]